MTSRRMTSLGKAILGAIVAAFALAGSWQSATAAVACNGNVCWHIHENYLYPPGTNVIVHPDGWSWGPGDRYEWREHDGQGYWRGDDWVEY
jgi:hypothetical protein